MNISTTATKLAFQQFLRRFHVILFAILLLGSLVADILLVNRIIIKSADTSTYVSPTSNTSFDDKTIDRIKTLGNNSVSDQYIQDQRLRGIRTNPFVE